MLSVKPHGGCQDTDRWRGSEETDREDGCSTNASNNTTAMVTPNILGQGMKTERRDKWKRGWY